VSACFVSYVGHRLIGVEQPRSRHRLIGVEQSRSCHILSKQAQIEFVNLLGCLGTDIADIE